MKLKRYDPRNIRVRGGGSGGSRMPGGRGGKIGFGTIIIVAIAYFLFGADPMQTLGVVQDAQNMGGSQQQQTAPGSSDPGAVCETGGPYALEACNALGSLNETWQPLFRQAGIDFEQPTLTLYSGNVNSGCGNASSAMGPFYCPADNGIYLDTSFYDTMERQMRAGGDFARYYVMAHEYGHHIQNLTGLATQVRSLQQQDRSRANDLQVRMELQADCYAGVWAGRNRNLIEPGDLEEGMTAAAAIGDDALMRNAGQRVNPESFTHGSSEQRMSWLRRGIRTGDEDQCDTFADLRR